MPIFVKIEWEFQMSFLFGNGRWPAAFVLLLMLGCVHPAPAPVPPDETDPVLQQTTPGAYGIPGGSQVYNPDRHQLSVLEASDGTLSYRILDVGERKILSISGVPYDLKEGARLSLWYRVMVNGYTLQQERYENLQVVKVTPQLIWLKKDDSLFFVLQR